MHKDPPTAACAVCAFDLCIPFAMDAPLRVQYLVYQITTELITLFTRQHQLFLKANNCQLPLNLPFSVLATKLHIFEESE